MKTFKIVAAILVGLILLDACHRFVTHLPANWGDMSAGEKWDYTLKYFNRGTLT